MKRLIILGTGGNCFDILDAARALNDYEGGYEFVGFLDDRKDLTGTKFFELPVLGTLAEAAQFKDCVFVNGIGSPNNFWRKTEILQRTGLAPDRFETIIHPEASVSSFAQIGPGSVALAGVAVGARAEIGAHVILLQGAIVSHDCQVGDYACIASGACLAGGVKVAASSYVGANASIRGETNIGSRSLIGMGSVVLEDVPENSVMVGNPARRLRPLVA